MTVGGAREPVVDAAQAPSAPDARVAIVLEVLSGDSTLEVARRWATPPELVERWVRAFVDAGSAHVSNRPTGIAAQERDRFLHAFAHELRTPTAAIRLWVDLLAGGDLAPAVVTQAIGTLSGAVHRLTERIVDIELLAAASLGRVVLHPERLRLGALLTDLPPDSCDEGTGATWLLVDRDKFQRILRDLWTAASLPPHPHVVSLCAAVDGPWTEVRVVRDGGALQPDLLRYLLEPFTADNLNNDGAGVTVGLYLARALAVAHGGAIGIDQDGDHLELWVRVPTGPDPDSAT